MTARPNGPAWEAALTALAEAQVRTEERLGGLVARIDVLTSRVDALAEAQARTEQRLNELAEAQVRTEKRLTALAQRVDALAEQVQALVAQMQFQNDRVSQLSGWVWEWRCRLHAPAYFGAIERRIQVLAPERLATILDAAVSAGQLLETEADAIERADIICRGRRIDDNTAAYLVVEVSAGVGVNDVLRASRRAELLSRTGTPALPVVAGQQLTPEASATAEQLGVWRVNNGRTKQPES